MRRVSGCPLGREPGNGMFPLAHAREQAQSILQKYAIRYVVVGTLERLEYNLNEIKFQRNLVEGFRSGDVVVYAVP